MERQTEREREKKKLVSGDVTGARQAAGVLAVSTSIALDCTPPEADARRHMRTPYTSGSVIILRYGSSVMYRTTSSDVVDDVASCAVSLLREMKK